MKDGRELAVISGRGIGVRLCVFFKDSVKVASAQENGVLVSGPHVIVDHIMLYASNELASCYHVVQGFTSR